LGLPPLVLSWLSFQRWRRLFSVACGLFLQNTGGGVSPQPLSFTPISEGPLVYADATVLGLHTSESKKCTGEEAGAARARVSRAPTLVGAVTSTRKRDGVYGPRARTETM
jgi:hypothetical protein